MSLKLQAQFDFHVLLVLSGTEAFKLIVMRHQQTLLLQQTIPVLRWLAQEASKSILTGSEHRALTKGNKNWLCGGLPHSWRCSAERATWLLRRAPVKEDSSPSKGRKRCQGVCWLNAHMFLKYTQTNFCQMLEQKELNLNGGIKKKKKETKSKQTSQSNNHNNYSHISLTP